MLTDTCPVCSAVVEFAADGIYHRCEACRRGFLRWVPDGSSESTPTDMATAVLHVDLAEAEGWLAEGIPGAAELVATIRARLERLARETG